MPALESIIEANSPPETPAARPCPVCVLGFFWQDPYGARHCGNCKPPSTVALARSFWTVAVLPGGDFEWEEHDPNQIGRPHSGQHSGQDPDIIQGEAVGWLEPDGRLMSYVRGFERTGPPRGIGWEEWWERLPKLP